MADFFSVRSGGTATGDAGLDSTTRPSDTFDNGSSYPDIEAVFTKTGHAIAAGDTILVSDSSAATHTATQTYTGIASALPIHIECVEDGNKSNLSTAATALENITSSGAPYNLSTDNSRWFMYGLYLDSEKWVQFNADHVHLEARNSIFRCGGSTDCCFSTHTNPGAVLHLRDCTLQADNPNGFIFDLDNAAIVDWRGGATAGHSSAELLEPLSGRSRGFHLSITGVDLSSIASPVIDNLGGTTDGPCIIRLQNCVLGSSQSVFTGTLTENGPLVVIEAIGCHDADAFAYEYYSNYGQVLGSTARHVTADTQLEGGTDYSFQINTTTNCSKTNPFRWPLPVGYEDLSVASTDTIRIRISSATTDIDQNDMAVYVGTSDSTTNTDMNFVSSIEDAAEASAWIPDHTKTTGTTLTSDAGTWTNEGTDTEYAITVTASASTDATSPTGPVVWLEVYRDLTFYVSAELVFEA